MGIYKPKRTLVAEDVGYGVCVWRFSDGSYLMDADQNHFCAQAKLNDFATEFKMRGAVLEMGITDGAPFWLPGFRTITNGEWEDQMESLLDGGVPDAVDLYRQKGI